jgi:hypothetical protein
MTPSGLDGPVPEFANPLRGRTHADAPDLDCAVRVKGMTADGYGRAAGRPW